MPTTTWIAGRMTATNEDAEHKLQWTAARFGQSVHWKRWLDRRNSEMTKTRYPRSEAEKVAEQIVRIMEPKCLRIIVAGSLRRRKADVGDVEILYISRVGCDRGRDLFDGTNFYEADIAIADMERAAVLHRRQNVKGSEMFGEKNKLMVHSVTGIPVDLFAATEENWWNYLVCRTGGAASNTRIATKAKAMGYRWNPYGAGFTRLSDDAQFPMLSERAVFEHVGLAYEEPWERQ